MNMATSFRSHRCSHAAFQNFTPDIRGSADKSLARPGRNKLQRSNSGFIQHTPHEAQYIS